MHHHTKRIAPATILLGLVAMLVQPAQGDFILWNDEEKTVSASHNEGTLYDESNVHIVAGGNVNKLNAYDSSAVDISGGRVLFLYPHQSSTVDISGGEVWDSLNAYDSTAVDISGGKVQGTLHASDSTTVDMSGGEVNVLNAWDSSTVDMSGGGVGWFVNMGSSIVDISGGDIARLSAGSSTVSFYARDFRFGPGLSLDGDRVLGTGDLSGEWFDGTRWTVEIATNNGTIRAVPEPSALMLMAVALLGGLLLKKRLSSVNPT